MKWNDFPKQPEINGVPIRDLIAFIDTIATGFDCDEDAHRYETTCRCCEADKLLQRLGITHVFSDCLREVRLPKHEDHWDTFKIGDMK